MTSMNLATSKGTSSRPRSRTAFRRHVVPISALAMRRDGREALAVSGDVDETGTPNGGLQLSRWETWKGWRAPGRGMGPGMGLDRGGGVEDGMKEWSI